MQLIRGAALLLSAPISLLSFAGCSGTSDGDSAQRGPDLITFDARGPDPLGVEEIYITDHEGTQVRRLTWTPPPHFSGFPKWSPDRRRIAFMSDRDGDEEIYVMDSDGANVRRLTHNPGDDWAHTWTPDGAEIAYLWGPTNRGQAYLVDADGGEQRLLDPNLGEVSGDLAWSPDGTRLLFTSGRDGNGEDVYLYTVEDAAVTRLTYSPGESSSANATWSVSGDHIVFTSDREGLWDIYRMNPDGSAVSRLTYTSAGQIGSWAIALSPDGGKIVFTSDRSGHADDFRANMELFVVAADGSHLRRITSNTWMDAHPDW